MRIVSSVGFALIASAFSFPAYANNGLTWVKRKTDDIAGVVTVGCGYTAGSGNQCDPYNGDMPCDEEIPVLCFYDAGFPLPTNVVESSQYNRWSGGIVATTDPIAASDFAHINDANAYCAEIFGPDWRVAEHHDGWGWNFMAYGNVGNNVDDPSKRFWVDINNQPNGTCWAH